MTRRVVLVDSGGANIGSVKYALERLGVQARFSSNKTEIRAASHVIMPGVGAAGAGMARLRDHQLIDLLPTLTQPVLGICLGMQLMFEGSDEDDVTSLGIFSGHARRLDGGTGLRVPHMGWNRLKALRSSPLLVDLPAPAWCYFVHSYALPVNEHTAASTDHGSSFCAVAWRDNFHATQFHPERSAGAGAKILENFIHL